MTILLTIYLTGVATTFMACLATDPYHMVHRWHDTIFGAILWPILLPITLGVNFVQGTWE